MRLTLTRCGDAGLFSDPTVGRCLGYAGGMGWRPPPLGASSRASTAPPPLLWYDWAGARRLSSSLDRSTYPRRVCVCVCQTTSYCRRWREQGIAGIPVAAPEFRELAGTPGTDRKWTWASGRVVPVGQRFTLHGCSLSALCVL